MTRVESTMRRKEARDAGDERRNLEQKGRRECGLYSASPWWTQEDTHALGSAEPEGQLELFIAKWPPPTLSLSFSFSLLSPPSLSFSFSPSISLHLLDTLPHQLFSSHTEMTPQGNVILIVCVCVCVCACLGVQRTHKVLMCHSHLYCILQVQLATSAHYCDHIQVQLLSLRPKKLINSFHYTFLQMFSGLCFREIKHQGEVFFYFITFGKMVSLIPIWFINLYL